MKIPPLFRQPEFKLFLVYYPDILRYARKLLPVREDAEDLTQCVFAQAWRSDFDIFHPNKVAWLKRIAYCEWVDALRRSLGRKRKR